MTFPEIKDLIPHTGDMIFVKEVLYHEDTITKCSFIWPENSPFADPSGNMPAALLLEVASQCVAAHAGIGFLIKKQAIKPAFLIAATGVTLPEEVIPAEKLFTIQSEEVYVSETFGVFDTKITDQEEKLFFQGQLKFYQP